MRTVLRIFHWLFQSREEYVIDTVLSQRRTSSGKPFVYKDARGICKSRLMLLSEGIINEQEATAVSVLAYGKGRPVSFLWWQYQPKLDLKKLNHGNKGLVELFEEIPKGEAQLRLRSDGRVLRLAKRIRVFIEDKSGTLRLCEIGRAYYGAKPKYATKLYAVTGSIRNVELDRLLFAAQREVHEELGIEFPLEAFCFDLGSTNSKPGGEHESDAYTGLISINQDHDVNLIVDPWPEAWNYNPPTIRDTRVKILTRVFMDTSEPKPQAQSFVQPQPQAEKLGITTVRNVADELSSELDELRKNSDP